MGLDQFAYAIDNNGEKEELAYWRKHPNLQGWMENLWESKGRPGLTEDAQGDMLGDFNCIPVELNHDDINSLEQSINSGELPNTTGFFFGNPSDDYYYEHDLEFCVNAKAELFLGRKVFYNSSW